MKFINSLLLALLICLEYREIESHGRLLDPPARSSCWREYPNDCYREFTDNELFCGGFSVQWNQNGGKCGICGDNWSGPRRYERGGPGYTGFIVRSYSPGQTIDVKVELTANHLGWFEFRLCNADSLYAQGLDATHDCLNQNLLKNVNGQTRIKVYPLEREINSKLVLPSSLTCNRCVLQWKYHTGNSWGQESSTGASGLGEGPQEEFYGCSDVRITGSGVPTTTYKPASSEPTTKQTTQEPTRETTKPTTQTATSQNSSGNKCFNGDGFYPDLTSGCTNFYRCVAGVVFSYNCPPGTLFDKNLASCNYQYLVNCS